MYSWLYECVCVGVAIMNKPSIVYGEIILYKESQAHRIYYTELNFMS
jgi:hypothetical protein